MKLLFDQNLSWRLPQKLANLFPDSIHIRDIGLKESLDIDIWDFAGSNDYAIVSKDTDFLQRSLLYGHPPKVVWLGVGNCTVQTIEDLLRKYSVVIHTFGHDEEKSYLPLL